MSGGKEIVAAGAMAMAMVMVMMSLAAMLTLAAEYEIALDEERYYYIDKAGEKYKEEGMSMVPKGCKDKCGNVSIYYPFGIGPNKDCYFNKWFHINCTKSSSNGVEKPYLNSFSDGSVREILRISYASKTITMKESFSPSGQTTTEGSNLISIINNTKLSQSPFFYSTFNRFMIFGCGSSASFSTLGGEKESIQAGCELTCSKNSTAPKFAYACNGINCCSMRLDYDVNSYQVNLAHSSVNARHYAFFLSFFYSQPSLQRLLSNQMPEKVVVPVTWRWTIKKEDLPPNSNSHYCSRYEGIYPPKLRGRYLDCVCPSRRGNAYLPNGCNESAALNKRERTRASMVPKDCQDKCGNISIYYPFGIGPSNTCYLNKWFLINCTKSSNGFEKPYLSSIISDDRAGGVEILGMSFDSQTITVQESISPSCQTIGSAKGSNFSLINATKLSTSPFFYSNGNNFMLFGCGRTILSTPGEESEGENELKCSKSTAPKTARDCDGINCHHRTFYYDVQTYQVNFTHSSVNACNFAFFLSASSPLPPTLQRLPSRQQEAVVVPVEWRWTITEPDVPPSYSKYCSPSTYVNPTLPWRNYWQCHCADYGSGNAYFPRGCEPMYNNDKISVKKLSAIIGVSASFGFILLLLACFILYKAIKKRKMKKLRQKFFKRNGGLLLQQQLLAKKGTVEKTKIFTANELNKATDHFNANRILGQGGQGTVYKGMLIDGQIVAVKKSQAVDENQLEPFINEVVILSQINHRNIVKLLGCCLETEVPILVYEFIPNGTLFSLIHDNFGDELIPLSWDIRLRIASEVAGALAYLHSATSIPIYHRDIKSSNILLDEKFRAKVSDFGTSRSISIDKTHLTTIVKGTFGYLDPEYFQSSQFTDKSDVYSFGVVLTELLTGQKPISFDINDDKDPSLITRFLLSMKENCFIEILDMEVSKQGKRDDVMVVALLAQRCLNLKGKKRPTMKEVSMELDAIRASRSSSSPHSHENIGN